MISRPLFPFALFLVVAGCGSGRTSAVATNGTPKAAGTANSGPAGGIGTGTGTTVAAPTLPDSLKNAAYDYYGLGLTAPQSASVKTDQGSYTGQHTISLETATPDKATFLETLTGTPQGDLSQTLSLTREGVFVESIEPYTLKTPHILQLPADITPGKSWSVRMEINQGSQTINVSGTYKIVGMQSLKVGSTPLQTLYVTGLCAGTLGSKKATLKDQWWYVKGRGPVKAIETLTLDGKSQNIETDLKL